MDISGVAESLQYCPSHGCWQGRHHFARRCHSREYGCPSQTKAGLFLPALSSTRDKQNGHFPVMEEPIVLIRESCS